MAPGHHSWKAGPLPLRGPQSCGESGIPRTDAVGGPGAGGGRSDKGRHEKAGRPAGGLACAPAARGLAQLRAEWLWGGRRWRLVEPHGEWGECQDWSAGSLTQSPALGSVSHSLGCVPGGWTQGNRKTHARVFFVNLGPWNGAVTWLRRRVMEGPDDRDEDGAVVSEYSWKSGWQDLMLLLRCGGSRGK